HGFGGLSLDSGCVLYQARRHSGRFGGVVPGLPRADLIRRPWWQRCHLGNIPVLLQRGTASRTSSVFLSVLELQSECRSLARAEIASVEVHRGDKPSGVLALPHFNDGLDAKFIGNDQAMTAFEEFLLFGDVDGLSLAVFPDV